MSVELVIGGLLAFLGVEAIFLAWWVRSHGGTYDSIDDAIRSDRETRAADAERLAAEPIRHEYGMWPVMAEEQRGDPGRQSSPTS